MVAIVVVSESELKVGVQGWYSDYPYNNPTNFNKLLFSLGIDINKPVELQENLIHRNRLNKVVLCPRWVGTERTDEEWLQSPYSSHEAKNDASGSRLVQQLNPHRFHEL